MSDYTPTGAPADQTRGASGTIRSEFQSVATAIATKADTAGETYTGAHDFSGSSGVTLPAATAIGSVSATELAYLDGVTSAIQTQLAGKSDTTGETYSGTHDFSGATSVVVPTPTTASQAVTKAYADAMLVASGNLPLGGVADDILVKSSSTNYDAAWSSLSAAGIGTMSRSARTSNTILGASNKGNYIDITSGTFTQTFDASATLGDGWYCHIRNSGTGDITIDPSGSETCDGLTSFIMYPGEARLVQCDGSNLYSIVLNPFYRAFTASGTFTKPPGYTLLQGLIWGGGGSGARNTSIDCGCGGGGGCTPFSLVASAVGTTETVTIAATTAGRGTNGAGTAGGNSTFGSLATGYGGGAGGYNAGAFYGGGGGGGVLGVGGTGQASGNFGSGGLPYNTATSTTLDSHFGGGAGVMSGNSGGNAAYGGGGGGAPSVAGGKSLYGGGGGGDAIGTSLYGGSGGIAMGGAGATNAGDGVAPGGGGGGVGNGTGTSGAGARGELRIWGVI